MNFVFFLIFLNFDASFLKNESNEKGLFDDDVRNAVASKADKVLLPFKAFFFTNFAEQNVVKQNKIKRTPTVGSL